MPLRENIDGLSPAELKELVHKLLEKVAELERTVAAQRDEIARLKGGPPRANIKPNSKPSGMEQATDPKPPDGQQRRRRGGRRSKLTIDETRKIKLTSPPPGSRFKGYTIFRPPDLVEISRTLGRDQLVDQAQIGAGEQGFGGVEFYEDIIYFKS